MNDDKNFVELQRRVADYKSGSHAVNAAGAFDFLALLPLIPILLRLFVKDEALRAVIEQIVKLLTDLFKPNE